MLCSHILKKMEQGALRKVLFVATGALMSPTSTKPVSYTHLDSIFDVQVKRLHEYKRQQLNVLNNIAQYQALTENPNMDFTPRTYIFASKACLLYTSRCV